jgi:hypothetical protein
MAAGSDRFTGRVKLRARRIGGEPVRGRVALALGHVINAGPVTVAAGSDRFTGRVKLRACRVGGELAPGVNAFELRHIVHAGSIVVAARAAETID